MAHSHLGMGAVAELVLGVTSSAKVLGKQSAVLGGQIMYSSGLTLWDKKILCWCSTFILKPWILFSSLGCCFFFHGGIVTSFDNPYYTHRHHYLWKSWRCFVHFFVLWCILLLFCCCGLFYCGFTFNIFILIVYKIGGAKYFSHTG